METNQFLDLAAVVLVGCAALGWLLPSAYPKLFDPLHEGERKSAADK